jgi:hypothetical protein
VYSLVTVNTQRYRANRRQESLIHWSLVLPHWVACLVCMVARGCFGAKDFPWESKLLPASQETQRTEMSTRLSILLGEATGRPSLESWGQLTWSRGATEIRPLQRAA